METIEYAEGFFPRTNQRKNTDRQGVEERRDSESVFQLLAIVSSGRPVFRSLVTSI